MLTRACWHREWDPNMYVRCVPPGVVDTDVLPNHRRENPDFDEQLACGMLGEERAVGQPSGRVSPAASSGL